MLDFPRWKITVIAFFTLLGITLAMPNFLSDEQLENMPAFLPTSQITLGLDLQGGAHLLMGVDTTGIMKTLIDDKAENIRDELRDENIRHRIRASSESLTITLVDEADRENALSIIGGTIIKAGASITNVG